MKDAAKTQSPGEHLRAELKRLGLEQAEVSEALGVSRQSINNIINGRQSISRAMAEKLGAVTGRADDYWLRSAFRSRKEIVKPVKRRKLWQKERRKAEAFRSFVLKLSPDDTPKGGLVDEIKEDQSFPAVDTWAELRFHLMRLGTNDEGLVTARALWKKYAKNLQ